MESMSAFFETINRFLGVSGPGELIFHPAFIGFCLLVFIYATWVGLKYVSLPIGGIMGSGLIYHYMWPKGESAGLGDMIWAFAAFGGLGLVLVYLGFIKE